jgi:glycosyltransferase involved in cell wall biosynthesis
MIIAVVLLTSGGVSGGAVKHLRRILPKFAASPLVADVRVFVPASLSGVNPSTTFSNRAELRRLIDAFQSDVVFFVTSRSIACKKIPSVVMVRNMEPLEVPFAGNPLPEKLRNLVRRWETRRAVARADRVIAVSQHVRDFLVSRWNILEEKVAVVYHGVDVPSEQRRPASLAGLAGLPFVFTAGSIRPARGLTDLIAAMAAPALAGIRGVVAGPVNDRAHMRTLLKAARAGGVADRIYWAGNLDESEMSWCFRNAAVFAMTSRAEACPNTVLEAMSHGVLSVSGDNPPMPEFFRDSARYYRPGDGASLAKVIREMLDLSDEDKSALRAKAVGRAAVFDWDRTADRTIRELQLAYEGRNNSDSRR